MLHLQVTLVYTPHDIGTTFLGKPRAHPKPPLTGAKFSFLFLELHLVLD